MATLALSLAGQVVGGAVGGPIGATIGRALGALAGSAIDNAIFGDKPQQQPSGSDVRLQGSTRGCGDPEALRLGPAQRQHHLGDGTRAAREPEQRRQGNLAAGAAEPTGDRRQFRRGLLRGRSGTARACLGRRAIARCERRLVSLLFRHRDARRRQPDRGQAGDRRAGLSWALLHRVRAIAAEPVRQSHSEYFGRALPRRGRTRADDHIGDGDPRCDRVRL